jgi:hypothetical protein
MPLPMPRPAPVTTTTLPSKQPAIVGAFPLGLIVDFGPGKLARSGEGVKWWDGREESRLRRSVRLDVDLEA